MAALWARLLRLDGPAPAVAREDDFFALGGDSLLALVLAHEVAELTGKNVVPSLLPSTPRLEAFCRALDEIDGHAETATFADLRADSRSDRAPTIYFFPPAGGDASVYASLASRLPSGLRLLGTADAVPIGSLAEPEKHYASRIEQTSPDAPVSLAGWSMGGVLAMSVAHELEARGRRVALVALFDARLPRASGPSLAPTFFAVLPDLGLAGEALASLPAAELERIRTMLLAQPAEQRATAAAELAREHGFETAAGVLPAPVLARLQSHARALEELDAAVVGADLLVIWARHTVEIRATTPWARYTRQVAVEQIVADITTRCCARPPSTRSLRPSRPP